MSLAHNTVLCITGLSQNNVMALECEWILTHFEVSILVEVKLSLLNDTDSLLCLNSVGSYEEKIVGFFIFLIMRWKLHQLGNNSHFQAIHCQGTCS